MLWCGVAIPFLYIGSDTICSALYSGYSYRDWSISELSAIGAPTAGLWAILIAPYNPLLILLGIGILLMKNIKKSVKIAGVLLVLSGITGYGWAFFPMNTRGNIGTPSDTGHLVMAALTVFLMALFIAFGSGAGNKWFRVYSFLTLAAMLGFGAYVGFQAPLVAANLPTPWLGIWERISVFGPMIWLAAFAAVLLRKREI